MKKILLYLLIVAMLPTNIVGQDQKTLENRRKKLESEINQTQKAIQQTQKTRDNSLKEIVNLEKQIELRKELIDNTSKEVKEYSIQINETMSSLKVLENKLNILRENYAKAIYGTYKSFRVTDQFLFVANSKNFSEALRRLNYLRKIGGYRKFQVEDIIKTQEEIGVKLASIQSKKDTQERLLSQQKKQESELNKNRIQKAKLVEQLKVKEGNLNKQLAQKKKEAEKLNAQIQAIIAKEIERQRKLEEERKRKEAELAKKNESKGTGSSKTPVTPPATPEVQKLSASFVANKGKLPWPVERGTIRRGFGIYRHPEYGGEIDNKGLDISTEKNANVRAVFDGKVISIVSNPIYKNAVIISHGDYFTVYTKLETVNVSRGQSVSAKQVIGKVFTDDEKNETEMHFELWQGNIPQNPSHWIAR